MPRVPPLQRLGIAACAAATAMLLAASPLSAIAQAATAAPAAQTSVNGGVTSWPPATT